MGIEKVDQLTPTGALLQAVDTGLTEGQKNELLLAALPGAFVQRYGGERVVRFNDQIILKKQVTHLGRPWPSFKKRIQIPQSWVSVERMAREEGLVPRFVGIYHYGDTTTFTDFDPTTYAHRKANNSAAHLSTNDLYQAITAGQFSRVDANGNRITTVRHDQFAHYLRGTYTPSDPRVTIFRRFNLEFLNGETIDALTAVRQMHASSWPDTFQAEWPGFYVEYRFDDFVKRHGVDGMVRFQKVKQRDKPDFDLVFENTDRIAYFGDLKASDVTRHEAPGNDARDVRESVRKYGKFWYIVYEHETAHARNSADIATIGWNNWKRSVGHQAAKPFDPLSYARRFKESVRFVRMMILEVNAANFHLVLKDFAQGKQPDGSSRALKVMINKRNVDNFLIYSSVASLD